ncbi:molybdopterin molybdotransferase [Phyllobacterium trifolii]|uniref:Molybdopterin molybdenumtransferase n=1 Tax=Phyllobacterium trifolii TaxID=300193 RepID=A0A839U9L9_9HYPH|nr:gephyrin-like molybdotransferase Glp [Phyllobacterium trifolii]MBB3147227.1 molybdopterin molybdotransferase [Phyllobacterium trifolii]
MDHTPEGLKVRWQVDDGCQAGSFEKPVSIETAVAAAVAMSQPLYRFEVVRLLRARSRVCAIDIRAPISIPPFDNSAMDGFAIHSSMIATGMGPWVFDIAGTVAAGDLPPDHVDMSLALRIFTGASMPKGFDTVIRQEDCDVAGERLTVHSRPRGSANVRHSGEDVASGMLVVRKGELITPNKIALLAALGIGEVEVYAPVRVGFFTTGSELVEPGQQLGHAQIFNSNKYFLAASLTEPWVELIDFGQVRDDRKLISDMIAAVVARCDVLLTTGGASAGREDHLAAALQENGGRFEIAKVAMRPGKPLKMGRLGNGIFGALPGNPYAAAVTFNQIVMPAIRRTAGLASVHSVAQVGVAAFTYRKTAGRSEFIPISVAGSDSLGRPRLQMLEKGSAGRLFPLSVADGVAHLPEDVIEIVEGLPIPFFPLS